MNDADLAYDATADTAAEQACLGAAICSADALAEVVAVVEPDDWYSPRHAVIAAAAEAVRERGDPVEPGSVLTELERRGELLRVGGGPYLHTLVAAGRSPGYYSGVVAAKAHLRRVCAAGQRLQQVAMLGQDGADPDEVIDRARAELEKVAARRRGRATKPFVEILDETIIGYQFPLPQRVATPWFDLDDVTGGLMPGTTTVIGARPGLGKTLLGGNLATHAAAGGLGVHFQSLEMPARELINRWLAAEGSIEVGHLHRHQLTDDDWVRLDRASCNLRPLPLRIDDTATIGLAGIRAATRDPIHTPNGEARVGLLIVDYLQLVQPANRRADRREQVDEVSRGLKLLARDLDVAVVALAQVNRGPADRADTRPRLSDLRESGGIEADADMVWLLHEDRERPGELQVEVAKNRHGGRGTVALAWSPHYARARTLARLEQL